MSCSGEAAVAIVRLRTSARRFPKSCTLILAGKIHALLDGRFHVGRADIDKAAPDALRHRIILNVEGEAEGTNTDEVIAEILKQNAG